MLINKDKGSCSRCTPERWVVVGVEWSLIILARSIGLSEGIVLVIIYSYFLKYFLFKNILKIIFKNFIFYIS